MINFCPNCTSVLTDNKNLGQGVKVCKKCDARFLILETTTPKQNDNIEKILSAIDIAKIATQAKEIVEYATILCSLVDEYESDLWKRVVGRTTDAVKNIVTIYKEIK